MKVDFRSLKAGEQETIRRKAVAAVETGMSQLEAARVSSVTRQAINNWMGIYSSQGEKGLKAKQRESPLGGQLKGWQAAQIRKEIMDRCPDQMKPPFYLWTREAVGLPIRN